MTRFVRQAMEQGQTRVTIRLEGLRQAIGPGVWRPTSSPASPGPQARGKTCPAGGRPSGICLDAEGNSAPEGMCVPFVAGT